MALAERLAELVSFDTQNPDGEERPLVHRLAGELAALGARTVDEVSVGDHAYVYARFGEEPPRVLVNAHVDTVPANSGYTSPPHLLVQREDRLHGLGAADTKGAIAAVLEALAERRPTRSVGILFSGDEEKGGHCIDAFLDSPAAEGLERAIVCEPTGCRVGTRHRGIGAATVSLAGPGGHSSLVDGLVNPVAVLARAAVALDEMGAAHRGKGPAGFPGINLNVAALDGGIAFNVIPTRATLSFSLRPAPGVKIDELFAEAEARVRAAASPHAVDWTLVKASPPFATRDLGAFAAFFGDRLREAVDLGFWTEAARFSERGIDAVVFGPGDIEQAHAADEFVTVGDLETARDTFAAVLH
ncbi:MAG TPA: M20/M25/M40 family metallo-hydrolase [Polyangia bacterium]|nr:M20/M25/M40 family metallo-hydrolase [Polyangia bacterium]